MSITKPLTLKGSLIGPYACHASHIIKSWLFEYARSNLAAEIRSLRERNCYVQESLRIRSMQYVSYSLRVEYNLDCLCRSNYGATMQRRLWTTRYGICEMKGGWWRMELPDLVKACDLFVYLNVQIRSFQLEEEEQEVPSTCVANIHHCRPSGRPYTFENISMRIWSTTCLRVT